MDDVDKINERLEREEEAQRLRKLRSSELSISLYCIDCAAEIEKKRRDAIPGVKRCITCQEEFENGH